MKLIKSILFILIFTFSLNANEKININFKDLKIMDLVKITSKIIDKNILLTHDIKGNVDFISNKPLEKEELVKILIYVLESKNYTLVQSDDILRIVKLNESAKNNILVVDNKNKENYYQMLTEVFPVYNANVDYIASKIRHLTSKNAKLVTNKESNSLVLTDFKDNIKTIKKVVNIMTSGAKKDTSIIELVNIKASDAKKSLDAIAKSMFNNKIETQKISIIENTDNNSLILIGKRKNIAYLKKYIQNIDKNDSLTKRVIEVISLKNIEAKNVIKIIDAIIGKKKYIDPNAKPLSSVDEESNSIVLMGPINELEYIKVLLKELDKEKAQVYVQARIIEVNDALVDEIGVSYGIFAGTSGNKGLATFSTKLNGNAGADSLSTVKSFLGIDLSDISSGLALGASLNLLKENGALDVVSEPSILAINNKESSIYVGETISVKTSSSITTDGNTTNENFKREDVGLRLTVKPRISNNNKVTLEINAILEGVKTTATTSGNADTSKKEIKTTAILNNGESVIVGGLIENKTESTNQKVPFLGDVPVIGALFRNKALNKRKNNLVIIITPYLIPKTKDITFVRNQLSELKLLEDKYLKDSLLRLKQNQIKNLQNKQKYDKKLVLLDSEINTLKNKDIKNTHEKRVSEILGY